MTVPKVQLTALCLASCATITMLTACGASRHLSPEAQAVAFADAVNLHTGRVLPASRWIMFGHCPRPCRGHPSFVMRSDHANAFGCETEDSGAGDVMSISLTPVHLKRNEQEPVSIAHPEAEISSTVYVLPSAELARMEVVAAHQCVAQELAIRRPVFREPGLPEYSAALHASLPGVSVAGLRRSFRSRELLGGAVSPPEFVDEFDFAVGRGEISLITSASPEPPSSALEQRLLSLLYARAKAHTP